MSRKINALRFQICTKLSKQDYESLVALTQNYSSRSELIREAVVTYVQNEGSNKSRELSILV